MSEVELRTEYVPLPELRPDPANPKDHDVGTVVASIRRFGFMDPVVRDDRTGFTASGHGRTEALVAMAQAGEDPPAGIRVDDDGTWLVPVTVGWASENDAEARAALVALNRSVELGGWDNEALTEILTDLAAGGDELLEGVGYDGDDLDAMLSDLEAGFNGDAFADREAERVRRAAAAEDGAGEPEPDAEGQGPSDDGNGQGGKGAGLGTPVVSYTIVFDNEVQQQDWYQFMRWLTREYRDMETLGERLSAYIGQLDVA